MSNQNPHIEEKQTKQCPKEQVQMDKKTIYKHTHKAKDRVARTPHKNTYLLHSSHEESVG
jgi:hypothetical protein